jgi:exodeoxyribonuclease VII small subunit
MKVKNKKNICFEVVLSQLEHDEGNLSLEESLTCFVEGIELSRQCVTKLSVVEEQINLIFFRRKKVIIEKPLQFKEANAEKC